MRHIFATLMSSLVAGLVLSVCIYPPIIVWVFTGIALCGAVLMFGQMYRALLDFYDMKVK